MRIIVKGKVQGVCFRATAKQVATELGYVGYVRNLPTGEVEIGLKGAEEDIDILIDAIKAKLDLGRIDAIEVTPLDINATSFEIT